MDIVYTYCNRNILFSINILLLEKNMPWVRNIFLVTKYQRINALKRELKNLKYSFRKKCKIIRHTEIIPKKYLPTKKDSSAPKIIECYLHNIKGLSENYCYFNDDTFVIKPIKKSDIMGKAFCIPYDFKKVNHYNRKKWGLPYWCANLLSSKIYKKITGEKMIYMDTHQICPLKKSSSEKVFDLAKKSIEKSIEKNIKSGDDCRLIAARFTLLSMNYAIYVGKLKPSDNKKEYRYLNAGLYMEKNNIKPFTDVLKNNNIYFICVNNCCGKKYNKKIISFFQNYF